MPAIPLKGILNILKQECRDINNIEEINSPVNANVRPLMTAEIVEYTMQQHAKAVEKPPHWQSYFTHNSDEDEDTNFKTPTYAWNKAMQVLGLEDNETQDEMIKVSAQHKNIISNAIRTHIDPPGAHRPSPGNNHERYKKYRLLTTPT